MSAVKALISELISSFLTGISSFTVPSGVICSFADIPHLTSAFSETNVISADLSPGDITLRYISPGSVFAAITIRSFPENSLLLVPLYWSVSVLSPLSCPKSRPAPETKTSIRLLAFSTGLPLQSLAETVTNIRSSPSARITVLSGVRIMFSASLNDMCESLAITLPDSS